LVQALDPRRGEILALVAASAAGRRFEVTYRAVATRP
jgi:hypothetical protein